MVAFPPGIMSKNVTFVSAAEKPPILLEVTSVLLLLLSTFFAFLAAAKDSESIAELIGAGMAPAILALIVLGIFRLFGKAKTRRSIATILFWTLLLMLFGTCGSLITPPQPAQK